MTNKRDRIAARIQALFNQAADRAGTPEGKTFEAKAFELLARYGLNRDDLPGNNDGDNPDESITLDITVTGTNLVDRETLIANIAKGLHCAAVSVSSLKAKGRRGVRIFGKRRHVERVGLLWPTLDAYMAALAMSQVPPTGDAAYTRRQRRSFRYGFIAEIHDRLDRMESTVAAEQSESTALALIDDLEQAQAEARRAFDGLRSKAPSRALVDRYAYGRGQSAARSMDLGQTRVNASRRAISA